MVARLRALGSVATDDPMEVAPRKVASEDFSRAMLELTDLQRRVIIIRFGGGGAFHHGDGKGNGS